MHKMTPTAYQIQQGINDNKQIRTKPVLAHIVPGKFAKKTNKSWIIAEYIVQITQFAIPIKDMHHTQ